MRSSTTRRLVGAFAALVTAAVLAVLPASAADAHDFLVSSSPAAGSVIRAPISSVSLTFDAAVLDLGGGKDGVVVTGPGTSARHFETGCAHVDNRTVTAAVRLGAPGRYTIAWRIISADGHPVTDSIHFNYRPAARTEISAGSARGPNCGVDITAGDRFGAPGDTGANGTVIAVIVIAGGAFLVIVAAIVAVAAVLIRAGRRVPTHHDSATAPENGPSK